MLVVTSMTLSVFKVFIIFRFAASAAAASYFTGLVAPHTGLGQTTSPTFRPRTCTCSCLHTHPIAPTLILSTSYAFSIAAEHIAISCISLPRSSTLKWCISSAPGTLGTRITHGHVESSFSNTSHRPRSIGICFGATGSDDSVRGCVRMVAEGQNARDERVRAPHPFRTSGHLPCACWTRARARAETRFRRPCRLERPKTRVAGSVRSKPDSRLRR